MTESMDRMAIWNLLTTVDAFVSSGFSPAELLRYLIKHEGQAVSRRSLLEEVWGLHEDTDTRAIDNFIVRLRRYIETEPSQPKHLLTVRGVGYRFAEETDHPAYHLFLR